MADTFGVVFHGNSESECIDFISAVRTYAKRQGKIRDNQWIADELYDAFKGKALKWYLRLPEDGQGDWGRLQQVLLTRWTTDDDDDDAINTKIESLTILQAPIAAPAASTPSPSPSPSRIPFRLDWIGKVGRVRIRAGGIADIRYLSKDCTKVGGWEGGFAATSNLGLALKVRLITTTPSFFRLEMVEHESGLSVLAAYSCSSYKWNIGSWGLFIGVDDPGQGSLKDRLTTFSAGPQVHQFWTDRWQITDTYVLKLWSPGDTRESTRSALGVFVGHQDVLYFSDPASPISSLLEASFEFEPLDN